MEVQRIFEKFKERKYRKSHKKNKRSGAKSRLRHRSTSVSKAEEVPHYVLAETYVGSPEYEASLPLNLKAIKVVPQPPSVSTKEQQMLHASAAMHITSQKKFANKLPKVITCTKEESFFENKGFVIKDKGKSPRKSLTENLPGSPTKSFEKSKNSHGNQTKTMKVYLSERQSGVLTDLGRDYPCAPPVTPMPGNI